LNYTRGGGAPILRDTRDDAQTAWKPGQKWYSTVAESRTK